MGEEAKQTGEYEMNRPKKGTLQVYQGVRVCVSVCICVYPCLHVLLCLCVCIYLCTCPCTYTCLSAGMCVWSELTTLQNSRGAQDLAQQCDGLNRVPLKELCWCPDLRYLKR